MLQASDQGYKWKVVGIEDWQAKHPSDDDFFPKEYWGSAGIMYGATLSNYFGYPFGNRAEVPSIQISVGGPKHLKRHEAAVVTVETTFLCEAPKLRSWTRSAGTSPGASTVSCLMGAARSLRSR